MKNIEVVILANSLKHHQHCIAGKCTSSGRWIRPVSNNNGAELNDAQAKCENRYGVFNVKPLQKVIMNFSNHAPLPHQPENYVIDGSVWKQKFNISEEELSRYIDNPSDLWGSTDRVSNETILSGQIFISQSLYLVNVNNLNLHKNQYGKRRASFSYGGINYDLAVTDTNFDRIIQNNNDTRGILCVSLGEEFQGSHFKIVAAIF